MDQRLTLSEHRTLTPIATVLIAIAFVATLALGFGLRTWTESTSSTSAPKVSVQHVHPAAVPIRQIGKPW